MPTQSNGRRASATLIVALLAVELLDELVFGARTAAWPFMRADMHLSYEQIGLLLALPTIVGNVIEPAIGLLGDTSRRRALLIGGGVAFALSVSATAASNHWIALLVAFIALSPASGAFVGLSQATLMDLEPERHEHNMARWVVAGSVGVVGGTALLALVARAGGTWRETFGVLAGFSVLVVIAVVRVRAAAEHIAEHETGAVVADLRAGFLKAVAAIKRAEVRRWLVLLECSDFMLDLFASFLALYLVDVAKTSAVTAAAGVALFTGVGLGGDALLIPLLARVDGLRYLRWSVALTMVAYPVFLLAPSVPMKFAMIGVLAILNSGWYSIPQARLYAAMPGQSATVLTLNNTFGVANALVPMAIGAIAERFGLGRTMWLLLIGPVALIIGLPRRGDAR